MISLSPCGPHGPHIIPITPMSSLSSPPSQCHPHIIPTSLPYHPHHPQKVSMWSPHPHGCCLDCLHPMLSPHPLWSPCCPIIPVIPTSSLSSPHHSHIVPTSSPIPQIATRQAYPHPRGGKNSIRFELIKIFQFCLKI